MPELWDSSHLMLVNWTTELNRRNCIFSAWAQPLYFDVKFQTLMVSFLLGIAVLLAYGNINICWKITYLLFCFLYISSATVFPVIHLRQKSGSRVGIYMTWVYFICSHSSPQPMSDSSSDTTVFSFWILAWTLTFQSNTISLSPSPAEFYFLNFVNSPHLSPYCHHLNSGPYSCLIGLIAIK